MTGSTVEAFRRGEAQALAQIIRVFTPLVRSIVNRFWSSEFEREEAAHLVWLHAYDKRQGVDAERSETFAGWLATLARHRCLDRLRRQGREIGPESEDPQAALDRVPSEAGVEAELMRKQLQEVLERFAASLEGQWRSFFQLHFQQALDYEQVGAELGISVRRCKYMKKVLADRARRYGPLREVLDRGEDV